MARWLVEIVGASVDLDKLVGLSVPPGWQVTKQNDETYLLESSAFVLNVDASSIQSQAKQNTLSLVCGTARLAFPNYEFGPIGVGNQVIFERDDNSRTVTRYVDAAAILGSSDVPNLGEAGQTPLNQIIDQLSTDPHVLEVMTYLDNSSQGHWAVELNKILEVIELDVGERLRGAPGATPGERAQARTDGKKEIIRYGWLTDAEYESLRSLHDPTVLGRDARHAVHTRNTPNNPVTSRRHATKIVRKLIVPWLRWK